MGASGCFLFAITPPTLAPINTISFIFSDENSTFCFLQFRVPHAWFKFAVRQISFHIQAMSCGLLPIPEGR